MPGTRRPSRLHGDRASSTFRGCSCVPWLAERVPQPEQPPRHGRPALFRVPHDRGRHAETPGTGVSGGSVRAGRVTAGLWEPAIRPSIRAPAWT